MTERDSILLDLTRRGGEALIELRQRARLSRAQLAWPVGRTESTVERWEKGFPMKSTDLVRVADVLADMLQGDSPKGRFLSAHLLGDVLRPRFAPQRATARVSIAESISVGVAA